MNDELIRKSFHRQILWRHHESAKTLVLDELGLCHGKCRADIAVVNGSLIGYEIKSDEDSLSRLSDQVTTYNSVFDRAFVVTGAKHLASLASHLPKWWGIILCYRGKGESIRFKTCRKAQVNKHVEPVAVARLLWKTEAAEILQRLGEPLGIWRQRRSHLYQRLTEILEVSQLRRKVRQQLKQRRNWRHPAPLFPNGD